MGWLTEEENALKHESRIKSNKSYDNKLFIYLVLMLIPVFLLATGKIHAKEAEIFCPCCEQYVDVNTRNIEAWWICRNCKRCVWKEWPPYVCSCGYARGQEK